uniref:Unique cartilage matrix-associated protein n=1 Tax=Myripristis murdjan TaxID=586833 RepID=A0A667X1P1_9TELE
MFFTKPKGCGVIIFLKNPVLSGAAVRDDAKAEEPKGAARRIFMPESDASNFFKRRGRRSVRYQEMLAEQRVRQSQDERRREYNEEQRDEYENYTEEARDEQNERMREKNEQVREFHYDGMYPRYYWYH